MKQNHLLLLRLVALMTAMVCALGAAAAEAYACYTPSNTTLTFYYDNYRSSRTGTTYDLNEDYYQPGWYADGTKSNVTKAVFNPSFANARPTTTYDWFNGMNNLQSITGMSYLNTSEVTDMRWMFADCYALQSLDVSHFNTAKVTDMGYMFRSCELLTSLDVSSFNTSNVTTMESMFDGLRALTSLDVSNFNTANVTNMAVMFSGCSSLTSLDVSNFNTAQVTDMRHMFRCEALTSIDLSSFNTSNVTDMECMFYGCRALTSLDLGSFNTSQVTNMWMLFFDCNRLRTIYVGNGWSTAAVTASDYMFSYCDALVGGRGTTYNDSNPTDKTYARIDGGTSNPGYFTEKEPEAYACYTPSNLTLTFYYDNQRYTRPGTTYDLSDAEALDSGWNATFTYWYEDGTNANVTKVVFDPSFAAARPTSTWNWFADMKNLQSISGLDYLNTSEVIIMVSMFEDCEALTSLDVSHFNTANVIDMSWMFDGCSNLQDLDVSNFNTANVRNMLCMFSGCSRLNSLDVSNFNTANVTNMAVMFNGCTGLTSLDVSNFNTAQVTDMNYMFAYCLHIPTLDLSGFNTSKVTNMGRMFFQCSSLTSLDLSSFNTAQVTNMTSMFYLCENLKAIYAGSGWSTDAVTSSDNMFNECTKLVGGQGTAYDDNHIDAAYAHIDGGSSNPGYLTDPDVKLAYACYTPSNTTLTFYYDNLRYTRPGTTYNLNTGGNAPGWRTDNTYLNVTKVVFNLSIRNAGPTSTCRWFDGMTNLSSILGISYLNTSGVINMASMFRSCNKLASLDLSGFNTSKVTSMQYMFNECTNLTTITVGRNWSTAAVTSSADMFLGCTSLVGGMGTTYDASHVNKAYAHIDGGSSNPGYLTAQTIAYACYTPSNTTLTFYCDDQWSNRPGTIYYVPPYNVDPSWYSAGISTSVTRVVIDPSMGSKSVQSTYLWFSNMSNLVSITGLNYLDTRTTTNMSYMFQGCSRLTSLDLSNFITSQVNNMRYMFDGCSNLVTVYVGDGWSTAATVTSNSVNMFRGCVKIRGEKGTTYSSSHTNKLYAHIDGGSSNPGYFTTSSEAYACYTPSNTTLTFYYDRQRSSRSGTTYDMNTGSNNPGWYSVRASVTKVVFNSSFAEAHPTTTYGWFREMTNVTSMSGLNYLNTSWAVNMSYMFYRCSQLTSLDLSGFNTANVINMTSMFNGCNRLTSLDVSSFNTARVTNMTSMFYGCSQLTSLDVSSFNTAQVTNMTGMFRSCTGLVTIYAGSEWSTAAVTSSGNMFTSSSSLVGGRGTTYDANHVDAAYAHIDGGTSNPGYFTAKNAGLRGDVNGDGEVNISDVTLLINAVLNDDFSPINQANSDMDGNGVINVSDVTALIAVVMNN